jgi:hypothetical protein
MKSAGRPFSFISYRLSIDSSDTPSDAKTTTASATLDASGTHSANYFAGNDQHRLQSAGIRVASKKNQVAT